MDSIKSRACHEPSFVFLQVNTCKRVGFFILNINSDNFFCRVSTTLRKYTSRARWQIRRFYVGPSAKFRTILIFDYIFAARWKSFPILVFPRTNCQFWVIYNTFDELQLIPSAKWMECWKSVFPKNCSQPFPQKCNYFAKSSKRIAIRTFPMQFFSKFPFEEAPCNRKCTSLIQTNKRTFRVTMICHQKTQQKTKPTTYY